MNGFAILETARIIHSMGPSELEEVLFGEPFTPLRLTLASGDSIVIDNPRRALIAGISLFYAISDNPEARVGKKVRLISIPNIVLVEPITPRPGDGRRRR